MSSKTHIQTTEILFPNTTLVHYGNELAPVMPEWVKESEEHEVVFQDGEYIIWWKGGPCEIYQADGTTRRFWPKPTLADAVGSSSYSKDRSYYRFHTNGMVEQTYCGMNYMWGPTAVEVPEQKCTPVYAFVNRCENYGWFDICGRKITFDLLRDSYLSTQPCDCTECYFEARQKSYNCYCCRSDSDVE